MKISREGAYYYFYAGFGEKRIPPVKYEKCSQCGTALSPEYSFALDALSEFLPKQYKRICCCCNIFNVLKESYKNIFLYHSKKCGNKKLQIYGNSHSVSIMCHNCDTTLVRIKTTHFQLLEDMYYAKKYNIKGNLRENGRMCKEILS